MADDDRDDEGQYTQTYPDEAFFNAIRQLDVTGTQNIADEVGCSYDLAYRRLKQLQAENEVEVQEVRNAFIWLLVDE